MNEATKLLARMALRHEDEQARPGWTRSLCCDGGAWRGRPSHHVRGAGLEGVHAEGSGVLQSTTDNAFGPHTGLAGKTGADPGAQSLGGIQLEIAQQDMRQDLEWIYVCWGMETKELVRDTQKDPVKRSAISRSCSLSVVSTVHVPLRRIIRGRR